ncbi:hypothetical protein COCNU_05G009270 [Cocos nucifera]|uniref:Uncharacterized protein n=1 Tax=Cocos nucifera TaxID=13894 RepID=A0A8K0I960_COCNU|nr:hypothetical protein COCNU_05G009270 [Cocos nucifera]
MATGEDEKTDVGERWKTDVAALVMVDERTRLIGGGDDQWRKKKPGVGDARKEDGNGGYGSSMGKSRRVGRPKRNESRRPMEEEKDRRRRWEEGRRQWQLGSFNGGSREERKTNGKGNSWNK